MQSGSDDPGCGYVKLGPSQIHEQGLYLNPLQILDNFLDAVRRLARCRCRDVFWKARRVQQIARADVKIICSIELPPVGLVKC